MRTTPFALAGSFVLLAGAWACGGIVDAEPSDASAPVTTTTASNGAEAIGARCTSNAVCQGSSGDSSLTCLFTHSTIQLPGGYCSETCSANSDCPSGSFCAVSPYDLGKVPTCQVTCADDSACRDGYVCLEEEDATKAVAHGCWTQPLFR